MASVLRRLANPILASVRAFQCASTPSQIPQGPFTKYQPPDVDFKALLEKSRAWGMLTSIDAHECIPHLITSKPSIESFVARLCELIKMERFGPPAVVYFGRESKVAGYSLMQLIQTSSITAHFADESRAAYVDIFSCAPYCPKVAAEFTANWFGATNYKYHVVLRGTQDWMRSGNEMGKWTKNFPLSS